MTVIPNKLRDNGQGLGKAAKDLNSSLSKLEPDAEESIKNAGGLDVDQYLQDQIVQFFKDLAGENTSVGIKPIV